MTDPASLAYFIISYLLGSVPFGLYFSKAIAGVDVRTVGSGNIGATNVLRAAGKKAALFTLLADCLKGLLPVLIAKMAFHDETTTAVAGAAAVLGHNFPVYLKFKGGKGVATSFGVLLGVSPWIGIFCLTAWVVSAAIWRYSSLSALFAFALYPVITFVAYDDSNALRTLSLFIFVMMYYRHRENIKRLLAGTEPRIGNK